MMGVDYSGPPTLCGGCRWGQIGVSACYYKSKDSDDLAINRIISAGYDGTCHAFESGQPKPKPKPSREQLEWAERNAMRAVRDAAVVRAEMAEAELAQLREDARAVLGRWHVAATTGDTARLLGLDDDEAEALTASAVRATHMGDSSLHRALRNVLALGELPPADPAT